MVDGKTYYYVIDKDKTVHVASDGKTLCEKDLDKSYIEATDLTLTRKFCSKCLDTDKVISKKTTFETKAEFTEGEGI